MGCTSAGMRFPSRLACSLSFAAFALALSTSARAEPPRAELPRAAPARAQTPPDLRFEIDTYALRAAGALDGRSLDDTPAFRAADMRYRGAGTLTGGGLRMHLVSDGWRFGWGASFFGVSGVTLDHAPLARGLHLTLGRPWGASIELTGGYAFDLGRFVPYLDLRVGAEMVRTHIDVRSDRIGAVQTLDRQMTLPIIAPRAGVKIRLAGPVALDVSWSASPFGVERASFFAGLTFTLAGGKR